MSRPEQPLVSVIVPFYNNTEWLYEAVTSAMQQTYRNLEIIIVDDGSSETIDLSRIDDPRIRIVRQSNQGPGKARNHGIELATGDYLAFLDSDDVWHPLKTERQLRAMQFHNAVWSCTSYSTFGSSSRFVDCSKMDGYTFRRVVARSRLATPTIMVKTEPLRADSTLRFSQTMRYGQDIAMWLELARQFPILHALGAHTEVRMRGSNAAKRVWVQLSVRAALGEILQSDKKRYHWGRLDPVTRLGYSLAGAIDRATSKWPRPRILGYVAYALPWSCFVLVDGTLRLMTWSRRRRY